MWHVWLCPWKRLACTRHPSEPWTSVTRELCLWSILWGLGKSYFTETPENSSGLQALHVLTHTLPLKFACPQALPLLYDRCCCINPHFYYEIFLFENLRLKGWWQRSSKYNHSYECNRYTQANKHWSYASSAESLGHGKPQVCTSEWFGNTTYPLVCKLKTHKAWRNCSKVTCWTKLGLEIRWSGKDR